MNTMPLEADTRVLIDNNLKNLGWNLIGKNPNVFCEHPKTEVEKKLLGGKRPDYVLYTKDERNEDRAVMVIEAKRKGERIDSALEQGIYYARQLNAPLVFATDGVFCKSFHTVGNTIPKLNGEDLDEFVRETLALKFLDKWEINTVSPKVQYDRKELIKVFDEANNMLRGDGLRAGLERFGEFANILFLKLISENEQIRRDNNEKTNFDISCSWDTIKKISSSARIDYINNMVYKTLNKLYGTEIFTPLTIRDNTILKEIMDKLDPLTLTDVDSDVKGDAFEYFLKESTSTKNDLGEYFTPRHIVKTMVRLVNPKFGEKIYDPFCGTGGFLIETFRHIERNTAKTNKKLREILTKETIYGNEITNTARITKMNMILAGDGHSNIHMQDSLANPIDGNEKYYGYDAVITNMPYSQKTKHGNFYDIPSSNGDSICVQHCIKAINTMSDNGRIALVVPEGFLFRRDLTKVREYMLENCQLQSVISLPQGVFLPYTGVKTNIIYATKVNKKQKSSEKRKDYWYFDVKSDGYTLDNHRRKLDIPSDLIRFEEYRKFDDDQTKEMLQVGFEAIQFNKISENSFILVGSRYREHEKILSEYENVLLSNVATFIRGISFPKNAQETSKTNDSLGIVTTRAAQNEGIDEKHIAYINKSYMKDEKLLSKGDILISLANSLNLVGRVTFVDDDCSTLSFGAFMGVIRSDQTKIVPKLLFYILQSNYAKDYFLVNAKTTTNISNLTFEDLSDFSFPLPPLDTQQQIVNELESYKCIVNGGQKVIENYIPRIQIDTKWAKHKIGELCELATGSTPPTQNRENYDDGNIKWLVSGDIHKGVIYDCIGRITEKGKSTSNLKMHRKNSVLIALNGQGKTRGTVALLKVEATSNQSLVAMYPKNDNILPEFLYYILKGMYQEIRDITGDKHRSGLNMIIIRDIIVPVPPINIQQQIVAQVEVEQALIESSRHLVEVFTKKIQDKIVEIWRK
jgi:type I restriction enzyme M protein